MAEDVKYFKLGLFFLGSLGLVVTGIIFLGVMDYFRPSYIVETYFSSQSVTGLEIGAPVKITGVTRGKVVEIETAGLVYLRDEVVAAVERAFDIHFIDPSIYYISQLPSDVQAADVLLVSCGSFLLSLLMTLYPAWRAYRTDPAEALRYE